jgi:SAM-dependent methyltransferase
MDLATFRELLTPAGHAALADAAALAPTEAAFLTCATKLSKRHPAALAKAALETVLLRVRGRAKFAHADRMYFTREALEQATGDAVAGYRAGRFAGFGTVLDLGCGVGGDALALAAGRRVEAIDRDPLRTAMAAANAAACGVADRVRVHEGDVLEMPLPPADAAFADPARRGGDRRHLNPERYQPPLGPLLARFPAGFPVAVKIAPGVSQHDIAETAAEVEFISLGGELKECVLWYGPLRTAARRATVLPGPHTLHADTPADPRPLRPPAAYLYDPDPAVARAGLAADFAERFDRWPVDHTVAFLTADELRPTPFATTYRVDGWLRFNVNALRDALRARNVGRVTFVKRGSAVDSEELGRKLKLGGSEHRVVILTTVAGGSAAVIAERV